MRVALLAAFILLTVSLAGALEVSVRWTPPLIYNYPPPSDLTNEASVYAIFTGDVGMEPVEADWLTQFSGTTWRGTWVWDDHTPRTVRFAGADGDTQEVTAIREVANTLVPGNHDGLIITINTESANLWHPDTGIYVWGLHQNCLQSGSDWEREATAAAMNANGIPLWTEPIGLRINGQSSRYQRRKGLRLYFDDYGTDDELEADLFDRGPTTFSRLITKSTVVTEHLVSSSFGEPLFQDLGHLGSRHRLVALYLDGGYWGAYSLRERLDDEFIEVTHDLASNNGYTLIKDDDAVEGDVQDWYDFLNSYAVPPQAYQSHAWYATVESRLDLDSYMDWLAINIFGASTDNGWVNNVALLRLGQGPWQYVMWDEEGLMVEDNLESNHFRFYASQDAAEFEQFRPDEWEMGDWWAPHQPWRDLFRGLMQNSEFKARFSARLDELMDGELSVPSMHARLDSLEAAHTTEIALHNTRWSLSQVEYPNEMNRVRTWVAARHPVMLQQQADFFEYFAVPVELSSFSSVSGLGAVHLVWRTERERDNRGFEIWRSLEGPDSLELWASWTDHADLEGAVHSDAPRVYTFLDTTVPSNSRAWYQLRHEDTSGAITVHDWISRFGPPDFPMLRINELMADNDSVVSDEAGEFDDWLELVNIGTEPVALGNLALSDDPLDPSPWPMPEMTLEPGEFVVVWCDDDLGQGPLHADFKLGASGESAVLFLIEEGNTWLADAVDFGPQETDEAYGRWPDGRGQWQTVLSPTPGEPNEPATGVTPARIEPFALLGSWPNPADEFAGVRFRLGASTPVTISVYDLRGRLVRRIATTELGVGPHTVQWDRRTDQGQRAAAGVYLVQVNAGGEVQSMKIGLVR